MKIPSQLLPMPAWPMPAKNNSSYECSLCHYPNEYRCQECRNALENEITTETDTKKVVKLINVSSGEDSYANVC